MTTERHFPRPTITRPIIAIAPTCVTCQDTGVVKAWKSGKPETAHMIRCQQCDGMFHMMRGHP